MKLATRIALLTLFAGLISACSLSTGAEQETAAPKSYTAPAKALSEAKALYANRDDLDNVRKALEVLQGARNPDDRDFELEHTFATYSYYLGSREDLDEKEAEKVLKEGLTAAKIARRMEPDRPEGHFWAAAILGEQARRSPVTVGITSIDKIREGLNKVLEIDPSYQAGSAYLGLGRLELNTRGLAGGSAEKAVEYLEKGFENNKDNAYLYLYLSEAYFAVDRNEEARKVIGDLLNLKPDPDYVPEYEEARKKAEKLLEQKS